MADWQNDRIREKETAYKWRADRQAMEKRKGQSKVRKGRTVLKGEKKEEEN